MPRKFKTAASTARNRDNQRQSRARRRELLEDMRKKLADYEQGGIQASLEMQRAARAVAKENTRLRLMLAQRLVSQEEIDAFLQLPDAEFEHKHCEFASQEGEPRLGTGTASLSSQSGDAPPLTLQTPGSMLPLLQGNGSERAIVATSCPTDENYLCRTNTDACPSEHSPSLDSTSILPAVSDCYCPPEASPAATLPNAMAAPTEMSCAVAASIVSESHGRMDAAQVLAAFGCLGTTDCRVKNTKVLQLIDEMA